MFHGVLILHFFRSRFLLLKQKEKSNRFDFLFCFRNEIPVFKWESYKNIFLFDFHNFRCVETHATWKQNLFLCPVSLSLVEIHIAMIIAPLFSSKNTAHKTPIIRKFY